jgi:hypothetical protein
MTTGGMALQNLSQEGLHRRDRREHAVAPGGIPDLTTYRQDSVGLQQHGPLAGEALQDRGEGLKPSDDLLYAKEVLTPTYRRCVEVPNIRESPR